MKKPVINKLKYPLWFHLVFYCCTVVVPIILVLVEGLSSHHTWFKWTFGIIATLVVTWSAVYKWLLTGQLKKIIERKSKLEHDYEVDVGNAEKIKYIWFSNEQKLAIVDALNIGFWGAFIVIVAYGIAKGFMAIKGAALCITALYIMAYVVKFITITFLKGYEDDLEGEKENDRGEE